MNKNYLTELISKAEHTTTQAIQKYMDDLLQIKLKNYTFCTYALNRRKDFYGKEERCY